MLYVDNSVKFLSVLSPKNSSAPPFLPRLLSPLSETPVAPVAYLSAFPRARALSVVPSLVNNFVVGILSVGPPSGLLILSLAASHLQISPLQASFSSP